MTMSVSVGGTVVTVRGAGFDVLPDAGTDFVRCRWGNLYAAGNDTRALLVNSTVIVCPSAPLPEGLQNLSIALNGQQFIATNLQLIVYPQPSGFSQVRGPAQFASLALISPHQPSLALSPPASRRSAAQHKSPH